MPATDQEQTVNLHDPRAQEPMAIAIASPVEGRLRTSRGLRDVLEVSASRWPNAGIVFVQDDDSERFVSYPELLRRAATRLGVFQRRGVRPGDALILLAGDGAEFVTSFWACVLGGIAAAPVIYPPSFTVANDALAKVGAVWRQLHSPLVIADGNALSHQEENPALKAITFVVPAREDDESRPGEVHEIASLEHTAFIQFSSGSTGNPKGVVLSHRNILTNIEAIADALGLVPEDTVVSWMPYHHDMGLIGFHITCVAVGLGQVNIPPLRFVKHPALWLRKLSEHKGTVTGSPNFGYQWVLDRVSDAELQGLDLGSVRVILNGAEPISWQLSRAFEERLARVSLPPDVVIPVYGMAEASLAVAFTPIGSKPFCHYLDRESLSRELKAVLVPEDREHASRIADEGPPVPGCDIRIVDEQDRLVPEGQVGHIQIRGDNVTRGYFENDEANRETFVDGWLRTGDLGFMLGGRLSVSGRAKDILFVNGQNFFAFDVEECASAVPGVSDRKVAAVGWHDEQAACERVALFITVDAGPASGRNAQEILRHVWERVDDVMGLPIDFIVPVKRFPKTTSGKIKRYRLLQELLEGKYKDVVVTRDALFARPTPPAAVPQEAASAAAFVAPPPAPVTPPAPPGVRGPPDQEDALSEAVRIAVSEVLGLPRAAVALDDSFRALGGTSLKAIQLLARIEKEFGVALPQRVLVECKTARTLAGALGAALLSARVSAPPKVAPASSPTDESMPIAVIGMAGRFPGSPDVATLWQRLRAGESCVGEVPADRWPADRYFMESPCSPGFTNSRWGGFMDDPYAFDPALFGLPPEDASRMDPQQRLFLEVAWQTLEGSGYLNRISGRSVGVFVGASQSAYLEHYLRTMALSDLQTFESMRGLPDSARGAIAAEWGRRYGAMPIAANSITDSLVNMIAARTSHVLNLRGPSLTIDTACSASLVAVHMACDSLRRGECELALAGGVNVLLSPTPYVLFAQAGALSPTGACRAFDASADGFVPGEGAGAVLLKPLNKAILDGDPILAVIKGSAVNNDGTSLGVMTPNPDGQLQVIEAVYSRFGLDPRDLGYVEAHGTGTAIGDPIEVRALSRAFRQFTGDRQFCGIGSIKSNVGHLLSAAGIAGLIKVILCLRDAYVPRTLHVDSPNPMMAFEETPFFVTHAPFAWQDGARPRLAAINSFGFGGTNCHMVLEEAPARTAPKDRSAGPSIHLLCVSGHSDEALRERARQLGERLRESPHEARDICYSVNALAPHFARRVAVSANADELASRLVAAADAKATHAPVRPRKLALMFAGQGAQYPGMARGLYLTQPTFRAHFDEAASHFPIAGGSLADLIFGERSDAALLQQTGFTQPAVFAIDYALGKLLLHWGIRPACMLGHSIGEYVAACLSGVMDLRSAAAIVRVRARLMGELTSEGAMAAVFAPADQVTAWLAPFAERLFVAAYNGTHQVVSGEAGDLAAFLEQAANTGVATRRLRVSQAFHTPLLAPMVPEFRKALDGMTFGVPVTPLLSNVTGNWVGSDMANADYWVRHLLEPVRFEQSVRQALAFGCRIFVEAGPDRTLSGLCKPILADTEDAVALATLQRTGGDWESLLSMLTKLYEHGCELDFEAIHRHDRPVSVSVPAYPLARQSLRPPHGDVEGVARAALVNAEMRDDSIHEWRWTPAERTACRTRALGEVLVFARASEAPLFEGTELAPGCRSVLVVDAAGFAQLGPSRYSIDPTSPADYARLFEALAARGPVGGAIYLWSRGRSDAQTASSDDESVPRDAVFPILAIARSIVAKPGSGGPFPLLVVTERACAIADEENTGLSYSPALSIAQTLALEDPALDCRAVDLDTDGGEAGNLAARLLDELTATPDAERLIVYRGGMRLRRVLAPRPISSGGTIRVEDGDTILLAGGATGIGAALALDLARRARVCLVLTGRRPAPEAGAIVPDERRELLAALELLGARAKYIQADVADRDAMSRALAIAHESFGPLRGVVHCAGLVDERWQRLVNKSEESVEEVFAPKVRGIRVLDAVTRAEPLKFFAAFSSISASSAGWGKAIGDYAAANFFMDQYCIARRGSGAPGLSLAINWSLWQKTGLGRIAGLDVVAQVNGLPPLKPTAALRTFHFALNCGASVVHVMNPVAKVQATERVAKESVNARRRTVDPVVPVSAQPGARTVGATTVAEIGAVTREVLGRFLGVPPVEIDGSRKFRDLGLDSAVAVQALAVLGQRLGRRLYPTLMFEFETPDDLCAYLARASEPAATNGKPTAASRVSPGHDTNDIAIVGMACKVPGASDLHEFWDLIVKGRCAIRPAGRDRLPDCYVGDATQGSHTSYSRWGGYLDEPYAFDAMFFGISPREATAMDPQQRLFLEVAWNAIQQGGYGRTRPRNIGVFVGAENNSYAEHFINQQRFAVAAEDIQRTRWYHGLSAHDRKDLLRILVENLGPAEITSDVVPGNSLNEIAARVSHFLDLEGPSMVVNSACSSSLVALHWACDSLRSGQSEMAIVGGVNLNLGTTPLVFLSKLKALSPTGRCLPFDAQADGMVLGEGAAALLLKPLRRALADGDCIHALIKGSAINNDGRSQGITVPTARGQAGAIRKAYEAARVDPASVTYVECHGTATPLGDPVEVQGLTLAFAERTDKKQYCALGSVKGSIGHLLSASGGPSVIKTVLALQQQVIPSTVGFAQANPHIDFVSTPFLVATDGPKAWTSDGPRRAGVNAFGFGGTNAHVVLEEYVPESPATDAPRPDVLLFSARSLPALQAVAASLDTHLERHPEVSLASICHSQNHGHRRMAWRAAVTTADLTHLRAELRMFGADGRSGSVSSGRVNVRRIPAFAFSLPTDFALKPAECAQIESRFPRFDAIARGVGADLSSLGRDPYAGALTPWFSRYVLLRFFEALGIPWDGVTSDGELAPEAAYFRGTTTFDELCRVRVPGLTGGVALSTIEALRPVRAQGTTSSAGSDATVTIEHVPGDDLLSTILRAVGKAYVAGASIDTDALHDGRSRRTLLPDYPFERTTYRAFTPAAAGRAEPAIAIDDIREKAEEEPRGIRESVRDATYQMLVAELNAVSARNYE